MPDCLASLLNGANIVIIRTKKVGTKTLFSLRESRGSVAGDVLNELFPWQLSNCYCRFAH